MARMKTWSTDVGHLGPVDDLTLPLAARRRSAFTRELVEAATSRRVAGSWCSAVRCIARVGRRVCGAHIQVEQPGPGQVSWSCPGCGEAGVITGFAGTECDMSAYVPSQKKLRLWGFDDEGREVLLAVLPLKLADGVETRLADGHGARAREPPEVEMAISRASTSAAS